MLCVLCGGPLCLPWEGLLCSWCVEACCVGAVGFGECGGGRGEVCGVCGGLHAAHAAQPQKRLLEEACPVGRGAVWSSAVRGVLCGGVRRGNVGLVCGSLLRGRAVWGLSFWGGIVEGPCVVAEGCYVEAPVGFMEAAAVWRAAVCRDVWRRLCGGVVWEVAVEASCGGCGFWQCGGVLQRPALKGAAVCGGLPCRACRGRDAAEASCVEACCLAGGSLEGVDGVLQRAAG